MPTKYNGFLLVTSHGLFHNQVLDSKLDDWWLVATMATDKVPSIKGWVPAASLVAKSNDGKIAKSFDHRIISFSTETPSQDQKQVIKYF